MSPELLEFFQSAGLLFFVVVPSHHMHPDDGNFEGGRLELLATRWFLISIAIEACVGNLWRSHTSKKTTGASRMYRLNDVLMSLGLGTFMLIMNSFSSVYLLQLYRFLYSWRVVTMPWDSLPCWFALVLLVDFCYYWLHRSAHTWHLFWGTHILHHSGEDYNLSTALRQSGLQSFVSIIFQLPLALLGFSPVMLQIHRSLNVLYQFWIHNSMVGWLGPVEYVLNTPSNHRMHHRPPGNCNYAGVLVIWDRLFGTFAIEKSKIDRYGMAQQLNSFNPVSSLLVHYGRMLSQARRRGGGLRAYWYVLTARRAKHEFLDVSLARTVQTIDRSGCESTWGVSSGAPDRRKFDGLSTSSWLHSAYCVLNFVVCLVYAMFFVVPAIGRHRYEGWGVHLTCLAVVAWLYCIGTLLTDARSRFAESVRVGGWLIVSVYMPSFPWFIAAPLMMWYAVTNALFWLVVVLLDTPQAFCYTETWNASGREAPRKVD